MSALQTREKDANVVVVDWLPLAHQLYTDAVNNTRIVGHSVATMLDWLQVTENERMKAVITSHQQDHKSEGLRKYRPYFTVNFQILIKFVGINQARWLIPLTWEAEAGALHV